MRNIIIFRKYNGIQDGYLWVINKHNEITYNREYATRFTLKQAARIVHKLNAELQRNYSYYYVYGYEVL